ncbi:MAG: DUF2085 domain-containing protein [Anaerolineales bacterium]|nr:DUF2085 domain-containing protein [Anaerolineales bacterium]
MKTFGRFWLFVGKGLVILAVGLLLVGWLLNTPAGLLGKTDAIGYAVCHRIDARTFHLGGRPMPLCARCSGMYLGAMLGLSYQAIFSRRRAGMPHWSVWAAFALMAGGFGVDGINSYLHLFPGAPSLYEPQNWLRLLAGTGMGLVMAGALFPSFNQTVWANWESAPAIGNLRSLGLLILLALALDGIVLTENPIILYPLALVSAAGVIVLLTMVYSMVWLMILRAENRFLRLNQLVFPLLAGFGTALTQIILLDLVRFYFTGTWDGFHLG